MQSKRSLTIKYFILIICQQKEKRPQRESLPKGRPLLNERPQRGSQLNEKLLLSERRLQRESLLKGKLLSERPQKESEGSKKIKQNTPTSVGVFCFIYIAN